MKRSAAAALACALAFTPPAWPQTQPAAQHGPVLHVTEQMDVHDFVTLCGAGTLEGDCAKALDFVLPLVWAECDSQSNDLFQPNLEDRVYAWIVQHPVPEDERVKFGERVYDAFDALFGCTDE